MFFNMKFVKTRNGITVLILKQSFKLGLKKFGPIKGCKHNLIVSKSKRM